MVAENFHFRIGKFLAKIGGKTLSDTANCKVVIKRCGVAGNIKCFSRVVWHEEQNNAPRRKILALHNRCGNLYAIFIVKHCEIFNSFAIKKGFKHKNTAPLRKKNTFPILTYYILTYILENCKYFS